jgi:hypothetical protein
LEVTERVVKGGPLGCGSNCGCGSDCNNSPHCTQSSSFSRSSASLSSSSTPGGLAEDDAIRVLTKNRRRIPATITTLETIVKTIVKKYT